MALLSTVGLTTYAVTDVQAFGAIAPLSPAVGCVVARLALREGFRDVSWRLGGHRGWTALAVGVVVPLAVASFSYGIGTAAGVIIGRLLLSTGSIWPAMVLHGWWNAVVQTAYDPATSGSDHALWVGESGALTTAALVAVAIVVHRRPRVLRRHPHDAPSPLPQP